MGQGIRYAFMASFMLFLISCGNGGGNNSLTSNADSQKLYEETNAVAKTDADVRNPLAGTWVNGKHTLTFTADNTYSGDFNRDGIPDAWGSVTMSGNVIIFSDSGGNGSCAGAGDEGARGCYTYTISDNTLTFGLFYDPCSRRVALLTPTYTKQ